MIKRRGRGSAFKCPQQARVFLNMLNFNQLNDVRTVETLWLDSDRQGSLKLWSITPTSP